MLHILFVLAVIVIGVALLPVAYTVLRWLLGSALDLISLRLIHRIIIGTMITVFLFFGVVQLRRYVQLGDVIPLVQAVMSAAIVVGLVVYYRTLRRWGRR